MSERITIIPGEASTPDWQQYLTGSVAPRPIAFVSTVDREGRTNLAPFSFFNVFSSNPPVLIFSPSLSVRENARKHTLENVAQTRECVVNVVTHRMVRQMALASANYPKGVSEFGKAGFTPEPSEAVAPPRVKESPVQMECRVRQIIYLGGQPGSGNLVICEIVRLHIAREILDDKGRIDPDRIDLVGRLGRAFYVRSSGDPVFRLFQPVNQPGIGFDSLPENVRNSPWLSGNELGHLAALPEKPGAEAMHRAGELVKDLAGPGAEEALHKLAKQHIAEGQYELALAILLQKPE